MAQRRQPVIDVFDEGPSLVVVADLPGALEKDVRVEVKGDIMEISTQLSGEKFRGEVLLPAAVDASSLQCTFNNGVLKVTASKKEFDAGWLIR